MPWLRYSDRYNRQPEIHALDDPTYRALHCLIEAAEHFDACGMAIDSYAVGFYPHARQMLRNKIEKLAKLGIVHLLQSPEDRDHDCPTCQTRREELRGDGGEELRKKLGTSATTSAQSRKTEPMWFCIRHFFDVAMTPTQKRNTKQGNAKRKRKERAEKKAAASRRDTQDPSHPSVSVAVAKDTYIDPTPPQEDPAPTSTASPSEPSDLVSWLIKTLAERRKHIRCEQPRWKDGYREHLEGVVRQAVDAPGSNVAILTGAVDGFIADPSQREWRYSPAGLAHGFDQYAAEVLEQEAEADKARRRAETDARLAAGDERIFENEAREKAERRAERKDNGGARGGFIAAELDRWPK